MNALPIGKIQALTARVVENAQDAALNATMTAQLAAAQVKRKLLKLPRPLKSMTEDQLINALGKLSLGAAANIYMIKSGKAAAFNLVDRRLNKFGKVVARVGIVMEVILAPVVIHELAMRLYELANSDSEDAGHASGQSYADILDVLNGNAGSDALDGLIAKLSAGQTHGISDLRFDQIISGKG